MSILLPHEQQNTLRHRYLNDDLFRHWSLILSRLERTEKELNPVSVWYEADRLLQRLQDAGQYGDAEIPFMLTELLEAHGHTVALTLLTVLFTRLANAAESAETSDENRHKPLCIAILREISREPVFEQLIMLFESQKLDNHGKKVFIQSTDPMDAAATRAAMDQTANQEMEAMINKVLNLTQGLKVHFKEHWKAWQEVWTAICMDAELMQLLSAKDPADNDWGLNEKMVCNVIGIFIEACGYKRFVSTANSVLSPEKNRRDYISSHGRNGGSSAAFSAEQHLWVEKTIKDRISG